MKIINSKAHLASEIKLLERLEKDPNAKTDAVAHVFPSFSGLTLTLELMYFKNFPWVKLSYLFCCRF